MPTAYKNRKVREELAQLVGDPTELEITFSDADKNKQTPYTRSKDSSDPQDQFSELMSFRIDGQLMRLIEEQVELLRPYYRTKSDLCRDAVFKWCKYLHDQYMAPGNPVEPVVMKLEMVAKQAWETEQRRNFADAMASVSANLYDLLNDQALDKLAEEAAKYVEMIEDITDTYWKNRSIREFVEMPVFPNMMRALKNDGSYQDTGLVRILSSWMNQKYVLKGAV